MSLSAAIALRPTIPLKMPIGPNLCRLRRVHIERALDLLQRSIEQGATIVAIGAFTNLALLEQTFARHLA